MCLFVNRITTTYEQTDSRPPNLPGGINLQRRRGIILSTFRFSWIWGGSFEVRLALDGRACRLSRPSRAGEDLLGAQGFERKAWIEAWRSSNVWGLLVWQLNEIWPSEFRSSSSFMWRTYMRVSTVPELLC